MNISASNAMYVLFQQCIILSSYVHTCAIHFWYQIRIKTCQEGRKLVPTTMNKKVRKLRGKLRWVKVVEWLKNVCTEFLISDEI